MGVDHHEVVIVGGGPVGLGLAIDLGLQGVPCALVERHTTIQRIPKGQNLTQRTMEHFMYWGVEADIRAARIMPADYPIGGLVAYGNLMGQYSYSWYRRSAVRAFYFTENERLPQYETERVLRRKLAALPAVDSFYGWTAERVAADSDGVDVTIASADQTQTLRAGYLVGCDGSQSLVRREAGLRQVQTDHDKRMVLLVFRSRELHRLLDRFGDVSFYRVLNPALDGYWQFLGRVDVGSSWFFHAPVTSDSGTSEDEFAELLHSVVGAEFEVAFDYIGFWDLRTAFAEPYRSDRIFLAGDAAHSHPPYGGFGINTGLEDARNLGWKLAARIQGWGGDGLLASYDAERRPVFVSTARDFIDQFVQRDREFFERYDPERDLDEFEAAWDQRRARANAGVEAFAPHYEGSSIVFGPDGAAPGARGQHDFAARPGHHLAPQPLSSGARLFDELGHGFALIAIDADGSDIDAFRAAAEQLALPLAVVADDGGGGRARYGCRLILVRPDHFVAWTGEDARNAADVLITAIGAKATATP